MFKKKVVLITLVLVICGLNAAFATDVSTAHYYWRGRFERSKPQRWAVDTEWNDTDNWYIQIADQGQLPTSEHTVDLNTGTRDEPNSVDPVIDSNYVGMNKAECWTLWLPCWQEPNGSPCVLWVTGGVLEVSQDFILGRTDRHKIYQNEPPKGSHIDDGTLEMSGGTITIGRKLSVGGSGDDFGDEHGGKGTINMTGGTITCGTLYIPEGNCVGPGSGGTVNLDGGTIYADSLVMHPNDPCGFMYIAEDGKLILDGNQISLVKDYADSNNWISPNEPNWVIQAIYYPQTDATRVISRNPELAWTPFPQDDVVRVPEDVNLTWLAGTTPNDVNGHDVYFGSDEASVRDANIAVQLGVYRGRQTAKLYNTVPLSLIKGVTYYWRIDEVNNPIYEGRVWNFTVDDYRAYDPYPTGTIDTIEPNLFWTPGTDSNTHDVYFGTAFAEVNDANLSSTGIYRGNRDVNNYDLERLMIKKTYYWRIDEVNAITIKGLVWSFTTPEYTVVEDFDSYADDTALRNVWHDYTSGGVNSDLYVETDPVIDGKSMDFSYENTFYSNKYSETYADTNGAGSLGMDPNFKAYGAKALIVNFYGISTNSAQPLYVVLEDSGPNVGMVTYDDGNVIREAEWHEWNIDLSEFDACGVDLTNVQKVYLGIGVRGNTTVNGGQGDVYFENIALAGSRCVADFGPQVDLSPDCYIDIDDLDILFRAWLVQGYNVNAAPNVPYDPCAWYKFDETDVCDNSAYDSSVHNRTATYEQDPCDANTYPISRLWNANGYDGNGCIEFDGTFSMSLPTNGIVFWYPPAINDEVTISAWVKDVVPAPDVWQTLFHAKKLTGDDHLMTGQWRQAIDFFYRMNADMSAPAGDMNDLILWGGVEDVIDWTHYAFVKNVNTDEVIMYVDGVPVSKTTTNRSVAGSWVNKFYIGGPPNPYLATYEDGYMTGLVDDFRIYRQALSHEEIVYLARGAGASVHVSVAPLFLPGDPYVDDKIDLKDFAMVTSYWLEEPLWPQ